jgi:hypothetical protein
MTQEHSGGDAGTASLDVRIQQRAADLWREWLPSVEQAWEDNQPALEAAWQRNQEQIEAGWEAGGSKPDNPAAFLADAKQQYFDRQEHQHFAGSHNRVFQDAAELEVHGRIVSSGVMASPAQIRPPSQSPVNVSPPDRPATGPRTTPDVSR